MQEEEQRDHLGCNCNGPETASVAQIEVEAKEMEKITEIKPLAWINWWIRYRTQTSVLNMLI